MGGKTGSGGSGAPLKLSEASNSGSDLLGSGDAVNNSSIRCRDPREKRARLSGFIATCSIPGHMQSPRH